MKGDGVVVEVGMVVCGCEHNGSQRLYGVKDYRLKDMNFFQINAKINRQTHSLGKAADRAFVESMREVLQLVHYPEIEIEIFVSNIKDGNNTG